LLYDWQPFAHSSGNVHRKAFTGDAGKGETWAAKAVLRGSLTLSRT